MGIHLDAEANRANAQIISARNSPTIVFVIPTDEELMIAEHTVRTARGRTSLPKEERSEARDERVRMRRFPRIAVASVSSRSSLRCAARAARQRASSAAMSASSSGATRSNTTALDALLQMEDLAGAAELRPDPLPRQHLARRQHDRLLIVGIEVRLDRIAHDQKRAILQGGRRRPIDLVDVRHLDLGLRPRGRLPLRTQLPQLADQLAAERVARAEPADFGVRPRALDRPNP